MRMQRSTKVAFLVHSLAYLVIFEVYGMSEEITTDVSSVTLTGNVPTTYPPMPPLSPIERLIDGARMQCPYTYQCSRKRCITEDDLEKYHTQCCKPCSCNSSCHVIGDCFADIIGNVILPNEPVPEPTNFKHQCLQPQLKPIQLAHAFVPSYIMVSECSKKFPDGDVRRRCEDIQSEFDMATPVEANIYNALYRNKYCAWCNFLHDNMTQTWTSRLVCEGTDFWMPLLNFQGLLDFIMQNDGCNILFYPPSNSQIDHEICNEIWASCNISGMWDTYDPFIDAACNAYTSFYLENDCPGIKYRNVFCFVCNWPRWPSDSCYVSRPPLPIGKWRPGVVSAFLNFNQGVSPAQDETTSHGECPENSVFDIYNGRCRELFCSPPYVVEQGECVTMYSTIRGISLEFFIKTSLVDSTQTVSPFIPVINERIEVLKDKLCLDWLCVVGIYTGRGNEASSLSQERSDPNQHNDFILVRVVTALTKEHAIDVLIRRVVEFLYKDLFSTTFFVNTMLDSTVYNLSKLRLSKEIENVEDKFKRPVYECRQHPHRITLQSTCPQIRFLENEVTFDEAWNLCFKNRRSCFTSAEYTVLGNGSLAICSDKYFKSTALEPDLTENWVSLVCTCLSVSCLMLTFLTYCFFEELRTLPGKNNMALAITMMSAQLFFQFGLYVTSEQTTCAVLGVCIHFLWLLTIFIMNVCCIHMLRAFKSIKRQLHNTKSHTRILMTYYAYCLSMTTLFVAVNIIYSVLISDQTSIGYGGEVCYISTKKMIGFTFALPVGLVVTSNSIMFFFVVCHIHNMPEVTKITQNHRNNLSIYIKLSSITGVTWMFGFMYQWTKITALVYVFTVLNCCQGVFIMLSFICNRRVVNLYSSLFSKRHNFEIYTNDTRHTTDTTEMSTFSNEIPHRNWKSNQNMVQSSPHVNTHFEMKF